MHPPLSYAPKNCSTSKMPETPGFIDFLGSAILLSTEIT